MLPILALAWAVAHPAHADAPARTEAEARAALAGAVTELRGHTAGPILVAAAGPDAERVALAALAGLPGGGVKLARVGVIGEAKTEVERALAENALDCAVRLGPDPAGGYVVSRYGACTEAPAAPVTAAATTAGASTSDAVAPTPAVAAPDTAVLESTYRLVALQRVNVVKDGRVAWEVRDGRGKRYGATELAKVTGDAAAEHRLTTETRRARLVSFGLGGAGAALALTGIVLIATRDSSSPQWEDYEPNPSQYETSDDYALAELQAEAEFDLAQDQHDIAKEDRTWVAGFCVAAGAVALGATPFASQGNAARGDDPSLFWDTKAADALLLAHNNTLRQSLGLAPIEDPDVPALKAVLPEAEDEDEDDDAGEPPTDEPDTAPKTAPEPAEPAPDDGPAFFVQPLVGPAFAGVKVTF